MSSASSTEREAAGKDAGMQPWHFFLLLGMMGATWAVIEARHTQPAALLLLSAAVLAAGAVGAAFHHALSGFFGTSSREAPLPTGTRQALEEEKALVLRSIKELEFDRAMRKVSDEDFAEIGGRLRARAVAIMEELGRPVPARVLVAVPKPPRPSACASCATANDADARFCKGCGAQLS